MAWLSYEIDQDGNFMHGYFQTPMGVKLEVYKNWIYLHDKKSWVEGSFAKPVVIEFWEGSLQYKDMYIIATRGPRNGIYFVSWHGWEFENTMRGVAGIGCYGYDDDDWIDILKDSQNFLFQWIRETKIYPYFPNKFIEIAKERS